MDEPTFGDTRRVSVRVLELGHILVHRLRYKMLGMLKRYRAVSNMGSMLLIPPSTTAVNEANG